MNAGQAHLVYIPSPIQNVDVILGSSTSTLHVHMNCVGVGDAHGSYLPELLPRSQLVEVLLQTDPDHFQILSKFVDSLRNGISLEIYLVHRGSLGYLTT